MNLKSHENTTTAKTFCDKSLRNQNMKKKEQQIETTQNRPTKIWKAMKCVKTNKAKQTQKNTSEHMQVKRTSGTFFHLLHERCFAILYFSIILEITKGPELPFVQLEARQEALPTKSSPP